MSWNIYIVFLFAWLAIRYWRWVVWNRYHCVYWWCTEPYWSGMQVNLLIVCSHCSLSCTIGCSSTQYASRHGKTDAAGLYLWLTGDTAVPGLLSCLQWEDRQTLVLSAMPPTTSTCVCQAERFPLLACQGETPVQNQWTPHKSLFAN